MPLEFVQRFGRQCRCFDRDARRILMNSRRRPCDVLEVIRHLDRDRTDNHFLCQRIGSQGERQRQRRDDGSDEAGTRRHREHTKPQKGTGKIGTDAVSWTGRAMQGKLGVRAIRSTPRSRFASRKILRKLPRTAAHSRIVEHLPLDVRPSGPCAHPVLMPCLRANTTMPGGAGATSQNRSRWGGTFWSQRSRNARI